MDGKVWADRAYFDDGEWVTWQQLEEHWRLQDRAAKYPNPDHHLICYLESLLSLAQSYHLETGLHLNVYSDIGELFAAITLGIKLNRRYAQGSDGRLGNDFVEVKTIAPFKRNDLVRVKLSGNFNKLLVVRINRNFEISSKLTDRRSLPKPSGAYACVAWSDLVHSP